MANFPAACAAKIQREGYKETPPDTSIRSSMDTGPDKVRRRSSAGTRNIAFQMFLSDEELDILDDFYVNDAKECSVPFDFISLRSGSTVSCRFTAAPDYDRDGPYWRVNASLEILP